MSPGKDNKYLALLSEMSALILVFTFVGYKIGDHFGVDWLGILAGVLLALTTWFIHFFAIMNSDKKNNE